MEYVATFAERLKELLRIKNITQAELSRRTGVSKSSITHYIKGDWKGKQDVVYAISSEFGVNETWLFGCDVPMYKDDAGPMLEGNYISALGNKEIMAKNIRCLMEQNDVKPKDVCDTLKIPMPTFSDWINAKTYPRIDKIELLANYFGILKSDLIEEPPAPTAKNEMDENLMELIRKLTPEQKKMLMAQMRGLLDSQ